MFLSFRPLKIILIIFKKTVYGYTLSVYDLVDLKGIRRKCLLRKGLTHLYSNFDSYFCLLWAIDQHQGVITVALRMQNYLFFVSKHVFIDVCDKKNQYSYIRPFLGYYHTIGALEQIVTPWLQTKSNFMKDTYVAHLRQERCTYMCQTPLKCSIAMHCDQWLSSMCGTFFASQDIRTQWPKKPQGGVSHSANLWD